jgi:hypothetical protein
LQAWRLVKVRWFILERSQVSAIQLRTVPGLWIGRRTVLLAEREVRGGQTAFHCGACDEVVLSADQAADLRDVVVKCGCGEYNQA